MVQSVAYWLVLTFLIRLNKVSLPRLSVSNLTWWTALFNFVSPFVIGGAIFASLRPCLTALDMAQCVVWAVFNGTLEELFWRGVLTRVGTRELGPDRTWLLSSLFFGLRHVMFAGFLMPDARIPYSVPLVVIWTGLLGLLWGYELKRSRDNLFATVFHHVAICILGIFPEHVNILKGAKCVPPIDFF